MRMSKHSSFQKPYDKVVKILLIGNAGVGKSSILLQFSEQRFTHNYYNTIGVDYRIKFVNTNNKTLKLQIWDTAGQDRFKTITSSYYRGADVIAVIYDIADRLSFENVKTWLDEIQKYCSEGTVRFIVGNKNDLHQKRQILQSEGRQFGMLCVDLAERLGLPFRETSAKNPAEVQALFEDIVQRLGISKNQEQKQTKQTALSKTLNQGSRKYNSLDSSVVNLKIQRQKSKTATNCCASS